MIYNNQKVVKTSEVKIKTGLALGTYKSLYKNYFKQDIDYYKVNGAEIGENKSNDYLLWTKDGVEKLKSIITDSYKKEKLQKFIEENFKQDETNTLQLITMENHKQIEKQFNEVLKQHDVIWIDENSLLYNIKKINIFFSQSDEPEQSRLEIDFYSYEEQYCRYFHGYKILVNPNKSEIRFKVNNEIKLYIYNGNLEKTNKFLKQLINAYKQNQILKEQITELYKNIQDNK